MVWFTNGSPRPPNRTKLPQVTLPIAPSASIPMSHAITSSLVFLQPNSRSINTCYEMWRPIAKNSTVIPTYIVSFNWDFNIFQTHPSTNVIFQNTYMTSSPFKHEQDGINFILDASPSNGLTNRKITPFHKATKIEAKNG